MVSSLLVFGAAVGFMVALASALTAIDRRFLGGPPPAPRRARAGRRPARPPRAARRRPSVDVRGMIRVRRSARRTADHRPLQVVAADLRRLSRELAAVPAGAPLVRWKALWDAFDRVLVEAADVLEVPQDLSGTPIGTARDIERLRVVCALEAAGLVVHG